MNNMFLVAKRDLAAYLNGYPGYVIIAAVLFINGVLFNAVAMGSDARYSHEVLEQFFYFSSGTTMIAAVLLTMRAIAEERSLGTDVLLSTSTASDAQIIGGKYLAAMGMLTLMTLLSLYMPALIFVNGKVAISHIAVGYLGLLAIGSASTAVGIFGSSLFKSQLPAGVLSGVIVVLLLTAWILSEITDAPFTEVTAYAAFFQKHFMPFMEGRLHLSGLVYYGSLTGLFLLLSTRILEGRRWE